MSPDPDTQLVLASSSEVRARLLRNAGLAVRCRPARIDEDAIRQAALGEGKRPRDLADMLAELKAVKISGKEPEFLVIGADQILECEGRILGKPGSREEAREQLAFLSGKTHRLYSAAVAVLDGQPVWRHVGKVSLTARALRPDFVGAYVDRNWDSIRHTVGCYMIEAEGVRLFSRIDGDFFHILGLPLIELLTWLTNRGDITT